MNDSLFNADTFLEQTVTGAHETKYPVIPAGEYPAISKSIKAREMPNTKEPEKGPFTVVDLVWGIDDAGVKEETGLDSPTCRQSIFLELHEGLLDMRPKKNIPLGRMREALGLNDPDKPFSFNDLVGKIKTTEANQDFSASFFEEAVMFTNTLKKISSIVEQSESV